MAGWSYTSWSRIVCLGGILGIFAGIPAGVAAQETGAAIALPEGVPEVELAIGDGSGVNQREYDLTRRMSSTPADPSQYRLRPGDLIDVFVLTGEEDNIQLNVQLAPDGTISLPWVAIQNVGDLTLAQASSLIQDAYSQIYRRAFAQVTLERLGTFQVVLEGFVRFPGLYRVYNGTTLYSMLLALNLDTNGTRRFLTLSRLENALEGPRDILANPPVLVPVGEFDPFAFSVGGHFAEDVFLEAWDRITIAEPDVIVRIDRGVSRPGSYAVKAGEGLLDILTLAGEVDRNADLHNTTLTRFDAEGVPEIVYIDLADLMRNAAHFALQDRDRIAIVPYQNEIYVLGQVHDPGPYVLEPGDNVFEALARAGGTTLDAHAKFLTIVRPPHLYADRMQPHEVFTVDMRVFTKAGKQAPIDVQLRPGDLVYVPTKGDRVTGANILTAAVAALTRIRLN